MDIINLQYDIELYKANNVFEYALDNYYLECKQNEIYNDMLYMEDAQESANKGLIQKFGEFIEKIIAAISKFFNKIKEKLFGSKNDELKNKMKEANKKIDPKQAKEMVEIESPDYCMSYDEYISKMEDLEKQLVNVERKLAVTAIRNFGVETALAREYERQLEKIEKKMDELEYLYNNIYPLKRAIHNKPQRPSMNESVMYESIGKIKTEKISKKDLLSGKGEQILNESENDLKKCKEKTDKVLKNIKNDSKQCKNQKSVNILKRMASAISLAFKKVTHAISTNRDKFVNIILKVANGIMAAGSVAVVGAYALSLTPIPKMLEDKINNAREKKVFKEITGFQENLDKFSSMGKACESNIKDGNYKAAQSCILQLKKIRDDCEKIANNAPSYINPKVKMLMYNFIQYMDNSIHKVESEIKDKI